MHIPDKNLAKACNVLCILTDLYNKDKASDGDLNSAHDIVRIVFGISSSALGNIVDRTIAETETPQRQWGNKVLSQIREAM